jgi:translocation and assembly module TamB
MVQWWQAWGRLATWIAAAVAGAVLAFLLFCFYTSPGHALVARLITPLSGDTVAISGLSGNLPNHLKAREVELRDSAGPWLRAEGVSLDWRLFSLIGDHANIQKIHADRVIMLRRQLPSKTTTESTTVIDVDDLLIPRIELDPSVLGHRAVLSAAGSLHYASRQDFKADLAIRRLDGVGRYDVHVAIVHDVANGTITVSESGAGIAGGAIGMPDLGPVTLDVTAGAQGTLNTIRFNLTADVLDVFGGGTIDIAANQADIDFSAVAPAMHPNDQLSWNSVTAKGHFHGSLDRPDLNADMRIAGLEMNGSRVEDLHARLTGTAGVVNLNITAAGLRIPGSNPNLFAGAQAVLGARVELLKPDRPVHFLFDHRFLKFGGEVTTRGDVAGNANVEIPSVGAVAGAAGVSLDGAAKFTLAFAQRSSGTNLKLDGQVATRGDSAFARLLGNAKLSANASMTDARNAVLSVSLAGAATSAKFGGHMTNGVPDFEGDFAVSDLSRAISSLVGTLKMHWRLSGPADNIALNVNGSALAATKGMARQQVAILARASGLPKLKNATVRLAGNFDGSPLKLNADVANVGADVMKVSVADSSWRSATASGTVVIAGKQPSGSFTLKIARLADLSALIGTPLSGSVDARTDFKASSANIQATAQNVVSGTTRFDRLDLRGSVADPLGKPSLALALSIPQLAGSDYNGSANARVDGPLDNLAVRFTSDMMMTGQRFTLAGDAVADTVIKHVVVNHFEGVWQSQTVTLASPATFDYGGDDMTFAATFADGKSARLTVNGSIPAKAGRAMNVRANGTADLGVIGSSLAAVGRTVSGKLALNVAVTGTTSKPQVVGSATLTGGQLHDYAYGLALTNIEASLDAQGTNIRLSNFKATAGPGTITGTGNVDLSAPGTPVDISFKSANARPITSDLITANMDCDLALKGNLSQRLVLSGTLRVRQGNINIPEKFPSEVATLNVRRLHEPPQPPAPPSTRVGLDLTVTSPGQIFVRGRGLEAEFEGNLKITGSSGAPQVIGALDMRRGTFALAGVNLTFQSGKISFVGQSLRRTLDPTLDFTAQTEANGITATLKITGTARQPKIELSSSPPMPQDEILAQLLFQTSAKSLSAMQLASVASAAATLGGGGGGFDPVGSIRKSLGLDRLAVGSTQGTAASKGSTTVEAGKYVLRNVYVAARQDISGGTRALVQVDLTKHLKAQAAVNTGPRPAATTSTQLQDNGDSIGLSYQFEY